MSEERVLVTGAAGEIGHVLVRYFANIGAASVLSLDLNKDEEIERLTKFVAGSVLDEILLEHIGKHFDPTIIFHLAGILSTGSEKDPLRAHQVNVNGGMNILELARKLSKKHNESVKVIFPSTIAVYGINNEALKERALTECEHLFPTGIYGAQKLYMESTGKYYSEGYGFLRGEGATPHVDFRALRFPGLLSADTVPTGGTSDYGPEMLHAAAQGKSYECFVPENAKLPFMAMPDAVKALLMIAHVPERSLKQRIYNVSSFSVTAKEIEIKVRSFFSNANITYVPNERRSSIVASWPGILNDSSARKDWGWSADYDFDRAFEDYLLPGVQRRYGGVV